MEEKLIICNKLHAQYCAEQEAMFGWHLIENIELEQAPKDPLLVSQLKFVRDPSIPNFHEISRLETRFQHSARYTDYFSQLCMGKALNAKVGFVGIVLRLILWEIAFYAAVCLFGKVLGPILGIAVIAAAVYFTCKLLQKNKKIKKEIQEINAREQARITVSDSEAEDILRQVMQLRGSNP